MASFSDGAFSQSAFSVSAWSFGVAPVDTGSPLGGVNLRLWTRYVKDETEEEKELRRIASGVLPKPAVRALEKAAVRIADDEEISEAIEEEFILALEARMQSLQLRKQLWAYELHRIREEQEDEDISILLLH